MRARSVACAAIGAAATAIAMEFSRCYKQEREHGQETIQVPYKLEPDDCDGCREDCPWFNTEPGFEGCNKVAREEKTCDGCFFKGFNDTLGGTSAKCYACSRLKREDLYDNHNTSSGFAETIKRITCERCKFGGRPPYKYPCYKCRHFSRFDAKDGE